MTAPSKSRRSRSAEAIAHGGTCLARETVRISSDRAHEGATKILDPLMRLRVVALGAHPDKAEEIGEDFDKLVRGMELKGVTAPAQIQELIAALASQQTTAQILSCPRSWPRVARSLRGAPSDLHQPCRASRGGANRRTPCRDCMHPAFANPGPRRRNI